MDESRSISGVQHPKSTAVAIATAQDGVISRRQLIDVGLTDDVIRWWVRTGRLHRIRRRDRRRDAALLIAGWHVVRYGWDDVTDAPAELTALLATIESCAPSPPPRT